MDDNFIFDADEWITEHAITVTNPNNTYEEISVVPVKDLNELIRKVEERAYLYWGC